MKIRYDINLDDLVAFNRFHCQNSPAIRNTFRRSMWIRGGIVMAMTGAASVLFHDWGMLVVGIGVTAFLLIYYKLCYPAAVDKNARRVYGENPDPSMFGWHELEIDHNELIERTSSGESKIRLSAIPKVVTDNERTYIYASGVTAYIIPHRSVREGHVDAFVTALRERLASNNPA